MCSWCERMALQTCISWNACKSFCFSVFMLVSTLESFNGAVVDVYCIKEKYVNGCAFEQMMTCGAIMLYVKYLNGAVLDVYTHSDSLEIHFYKELTFLKWGNLKIIIFVLTTWQSHNNESQQ